MRPILTARHHDLIEDLEWLLTAGARTWDEAYARVGIGPAYARNLWCVTGRKPWHPAVALETGLRPAEISR